MDMLNTITLDGVCSSTWDLKFDVEKHSILPTQRKYAIEIPAFDGNIDFGIGGYDSLIISRDVYFMGKWADLRANRDNIRAWLASIDGEAKKYVSDNEPEKYYMAKIYSNIEFAVNPERKIGTVTFECNPPWQYYGEILLTPENILWNNQDNLDGSQWYKQFTSSGSFKLTNTGSQSVKPIIKLIGNIPANTKLTYGTQNWQYDVALVNDGIVIDCGNETVTRYSDGLNLAGNCLTYDDFFNLSAGQIQIDITSTGLGAFPSSLDIFIEFAPIV